MSILADVGKISSDSQGQAAALSALQTAQAAVGPLQDAYDAFGGTISADDQQLSSDLQAQPSGPNTIALVQNPDGTYTGYQYSTAAPGFTATPAVIAT